MVVFRQSQQHLFVSIVCLFVISHLFFSPSPNLSQSLPDPNQAGGNRQWIVDIMGSVPRPGIYVFNRPPTVIDVMTKAGVRQFSARSVHGMATRRLRSNTTVHVMSCHVGFEITIRPFANSPSAFIAGLPMDLNTVSADVLSLAPGLSKKLAYRMVAFREKHGGFRTWNDLQRVKGIGPATVAYLRDYLQIDFSFIPSQKKTPTTNVVGAKKNPAASYSPTQSPEQYHRR